jgi:hypothetical protein
MQWNVIIDFFEKPVRYNFVNEPAYQAVGSGHGSHLAEITKSGTGKTCMIIGPRDSTTLWLY